LLFLPHALLTDSDLRLARKYLSQNLLFKIIVRSTMTKRNGSLEYLIINQFAANESLSLD
jgi:hypothetical protein